MNSDPYGKGWIFKIKPSNMDELNNLMTGAAAVEEFIQSEIKRVLG